MRTRLGLVAALLTLVSTLAGCSQSDYDACRDEAVDEMAEMQKDRAANGGENSISGYFNEQQSYADSQCSDLYES